MADEYIDKVRKRQIHVYHIFGQHALSHEDLTYLNEKARESRKKFPIQLVNIEVNHAYTRALEFLLFTT